jgi:hypothetical protein
VFLIDNEIYVAILPTTLANEIDLSINLGTKLELKMSKAPETIPTIDYETAMKISSQPAKFSLHSINCGNLFFELVTINDEKFKVPYDPDLTIKGKYINSASN